MKSSTFGLDLNLFPRNTQQRQSQAAQTHRKYISKFKKNSLKWLQSGKDTIIKWRKFANEFNLRLATGGLFAIYKTVAK